MSPEPTAAPRPVKVLLVDDEVLVRVPIAEALRDAGFLVVEAGDAGEALSFLAGGESIDLVFTDLQMPGPMDGIALAERVRRLYPRIPIVLTSGNPPRGVNLNRFGPFIAKPYELSLAVQLALTMTDADD